MTGWRFACAMVCIFAFTAGADADIRVDTDFPGGSGVVEEIDQPSGYIRINPADHAGRGWRCWWYIRLSGLTPGQRITLDVGEAPWATPSQASYSSDGGRTWLHTEPGQRLGKRIHYSLLIDKESVAVAWGPPFVPADAADLVARLAGSSSHATAFSLCKTRENRDTPALRVVTPGEPGEQRPLIWIQARQHAWESGASWVCRGFAEWLMSDDAAAVDLRRSAEVVIIPIMDIDNVHRGAGGKKSEAAGSQPRLERYPALAGRGGCPGGDPGSC